MSSSAERAGVVPAALSFLALYNPSLSATDDTLEDQIVYYYSERINGATVGQGTRGDKDVIEEAKEVRDEKLRQIGLAQGMIDFANNFSNDKAVDSIETEKSRIIIHELEKDWWLLASINLTRLPSTSEVPLQNESPKSGTVFEYSAREVCPPALLLQQVLRAHRIFLLHQAPSLSQLFTRISRSRFCALLKRFWDDFIRGWDVLLHGNPGVDVFNGLKLAAGGELGIGVGEEEWGSGERDVLEGFVERTEGLVDLVVSRFGDATPNQQSPSSQRTAQNNVRPERVHTTYPKPSDGVVFSGIGALSRSTIRDISSWMEWLHMYDREAYGVRDNPSSAPRRKRRKDHTTKTQDDEESPRSRGNQQQSKTVFSGKLDGTSDNTHEVSPGIPPPIVKSQKARAAVSSGPLTKMQENSTKGQAIDCDNEGPDTASSNTETFVKYLTLGVYGSTWGIPSGRPPLQQHVSASREKGGNAESINNHGINRFSADTATMAGFFLIGLQGEVDESVQSMTANLDTQSGINAENADENYGNDRVLMRTLHVKRKRPDPTAGSNGSTQDRNLAPVDNGFDRVRVVVYMQPPFIFTLLFELQTDSLAIPSFYHSLHHQLGPLRRPLLNSTSPSKVSDRLWGATAPKKTASIRSTQPICDLVFDPVRLTIHTTIPNIPEPGPGPLDSNNTVPWTRVEALSVHSQIINTYTSTRRNTSELERTCKTSRGWWVVWMRLPQAPFSRDYRNTATAHEAFLIRKASDYVSPAGRKSSSRPEREVSGMGGWGPGKLAEGIGIDARQYIEGLLSLNR